MLRVKLEDCAVSTPSDHHIPRSYKYLLVFKYLDSRA